MFLITEIFSESFSELLAMDYGLHNLGHLFNKDIITNSVINVFLNV